MKTQKFYALQWRRFAQESVPAQSLYRANRAEREFNQSSARKGMLLDLTPAREFSCLYKESGNTLWGRPDSTPFRANGSTPYCEPTEKEERQNQLSREWMEMWDRYQMELRDPIETNYTQQFIGHPSHYRLSPRWILKINRIPINLR